MTAAAAAPTADIPAEYASLVTEDDIAEYEARGYWISPKLMSDDEIAELREAVIRTCQGERDFDNMHWIRFNKPPAGSPAIQQVCNGWWVNAVVRKTVLSPKVGYIGTRLMRTTEARLWHDQVLYKPGVGPDGAGEKMGNVGWHQDCGHWQCANTFNFCTAWIALQDTDLNNGGMRTIVGSHKWGLMRDAYTFGEKDLEELRARFEQPDRPWVDEPCLLKAGQASFHHGLTFHGSGPNLTFEPRLSVVAHMMPADCGFKPDGIYHENSALLGPGTKEGDLFAGKYFPRLWPPDADGPGI